MSVIKEFLAVLGFCSVTAACMAATVYVYDDAGSVRQGLPTQGYEVAMVNYLSNIKVI